MTTDDLLDYLRQQYRAVKVLPDGSIAVQADLLFTRAIILGVDQCGYARRFCFEDKARCDHEYEALQSEDDEPTGWIARR